MLQQQQQLARPPTAWRLLGPPQALQRLQRVARRPTNTSTRRSGLRARPTAAAQRRQEDEEEEGEDVEQEEGAPALPTPLDYQQTLLKSFTLGGVGLHSGEYAVVRVRPAYAGEGRYFVRVPQGTNAARFRFDAGSLEEVDPAAALQPLGPGDAPAAAEADTEDLRVEWFQGFLAAQEDEGFIGTFGEWLEQLVEEGRMAAPLRARLLGLDEPEADPLAFEPEVEPDHRRRPACSLSDEAEEIEPLNPDDPSLVMASITSVVEPDLPCTQLGEGDTRVMSVELLLAALEACGVDNARIEVEGGHEVPVLDNSALGWCIDIQMAGLRPAPVRGGEEPAPEGGEDVLLLQRDVLMPSAAVAVQDAHGWIAFFPGPHARLTAGIDHTEAAPIIGCQWFTWRSDDAHFRHTLAPARAYAETIEHLFALRDAGFVKAGAESLFCIAAGDRWWDPDLVRMVYDEPVRYKLAQLVGNLALLSMAGCQGIPVGHITAYNASPQLQLAFVARMVDAVEERDFVSLGRVLELQEEHAAGIHGGTAGERRSETSAGAPPGVDSRLPDTPHIAEPPRDAAAFVDAESAMMQHEEEGEEEGEGEA